MKPRLPQLREDVADAITFHPANRTGTPEQRRPVSLMLADAVLRVVRPCTCDGDPIECSHEAARGQAEEEARQFRAERDEAVVRADAQFKTRMEELAERDTLKAAKEQAEQLAAEWQAACEAHGADGETLIAAIERVRALCARGPGEHNEHQIWIADVLTALGTPSTPESPEEGNDNA